MEINFELRYVTNKFCKALSAICNSLRGHSLILGTISEKAMASHSSTLAWKIPWTEEPDGLQSMGLPGIGHD